eukprot:CCRYP_004336-RA/>CCRYP_004336-RA protein AED:0.25 eAED:0.25 QI:65/1/1/1/0.75/0.8/5/136/650
MMPCRGCWRFPRGGFVGMRITWLKTCRLFRKFITDKGGDPAEFRETRAAFEVLRSLYQEGNVQNGTFASYFGEADDFPDIDELYETYAKSNSYPSWTYFSEAAETPVPSYRVEKAKSARSSCKGCKGPIAKDEVRVGSLDDRGGGYGRWHHLVGNGGACKGWRVPKKVWTGLTDPTDAAASLSDLLCMEEILLCGLASLDGASQVLFARHCCDEDNWAGHKRKKVEGENKKGKKKSKKSDEAEEILVTTVVAARPTSSSLKDTKEEETKPAATASSGYALPNPASPSTVDATFLSKCIFIIAGSFPELVRGSTSAKDAGVGDVKVLIESFGGKVATRFSKNTSYVIVGKDPSRQKFSDAEIRGVPILALNMLIAVLNQSHTFQSVASLPNLTVESFEGTAYQAGGGPTLTIDSSIAASLQSTSTAAAKNPAKKKTAAAKKTTQATKAKPPKKEKKEKPPSDPATVAMAALAAAAASRNAHRTIAASGAAAAATSSTNQELVPRASSSTTSTAMVASSGKARFVIPRPGVDGAIPDVLKGKKFVLTGIFPEVGGGSGLTLGKDRVTQMIESFSGRVTSAVSGATDYLVVGREPGASKVGKAHQRGLPLLDILTLQRLILGQAQLENIANEPPPRIESFSSGYGGNGLLTRG